MSHDFDGRHSDVTEAPAAALKWERLEQRQKALLLAVMSGMSPDQVKECWRKAVEQHLQETLAEPLPVGLALQTVGSLFRRTLIN